MRYSNISVTNARWHSDENEEGMVEAVKGEGKVVEEMRRENRKERREERREEMKENGKGEEGKWRK